MHRCIVASSPLGQYLSKLLESGAKWDEAWLEREVRKSPEEAKGSHTTVVRPTRYGANVRKDKST